MKKIWYRLFVAVFVGLLGFGLWITLRDQDWTPVIRLAERIGPGEAIAVLLAAMVINATGLIFGILAWRAVFLDLGKQVGTWTALRLCLVGFLAKFVPGRFVALPVLLRMSKEIDLGMVRLGSVFVLSWGITAFTGCTIGMAAGPGVAGVSMGWLLATAVPLVIMLWRPDLLAWGINLVERLLRRPSQRITASGSGVRQAIGLQTVSWIVSGHHLWLLAVVAGAPPGPAYLVCVAGFPVATTAGILVMVAPDGIGVREVVLVAALSTVLPVPLATTVTLASRLACTISEIAVGAGGLALAQYKHRLTAARASPASAPASAPASP